MWNACGNTRLVTRMWVEASLSRRVRENAQAVVGRLDVDLRPRVLAHDLRDRHVGIGRLVAEQPAVGVAGLIVVEEAVQERGVRGIDADFQRLQPVAVDEALEREGVRGRRDEAVEMRERRRLARAHIGEQDAVLLHHRIGLLADAVAHAAAFRLRRRLQALAADVEQPAVEGAAQAAVLQPAEREIGAAMRAGAADQAVAPLAVLEDHEVLAEQPHRLDRPVAGELVDQRRRLPIAPHQRAGGRAGADAGDEIVLFLAEHGEPRWSIGPFIRPPARRFHRPGTAAAAPALSRRKRATTRSRPMHKEQGQNGRNARSRPGRDFSIGPVLAVLVVSLTLVLCSTGSSISDSSARRDETPLAPRQRQHLRRRRQASSWRPRSTARPPSRHPTSARARGRETAPACSG